MGGDVFAGTDPVCEVDDESEERFVDVVGTEQRDEGAECEGLTFADALMRANLLSETLSEGVVSSSDLQLC